MSIRVFIHTMSKRAETPALLDSGATENFINHQYATHLRLPTKRLEKARKVYNVDGTLNKKGDILFYTDLEVRTGQKYTNMRFFLTDLGPQRLILGYPWFAAVQPRIDWARGWIDYEQLPVVIKTPNAHRAVCLNRIVTIRPKKNTPLTQIRRLTQTKASQLAEQSLTKEKPLLPPDLFIRLTTEPSEEWMELERRIERTQRGFLSLILKWRGKHHLQLRPSTTVPNLKLWHAQRRMVIPPDDQLRKDILYTQHGQSTAGHPGRDETIRGVSATFWWPGMNAWITNYVKGCATCQQNKNLTKKKRFPLFHIPAHPSALPFKTVAMDLITQLVTAGTDETGRLEVASARVELKA
jgi:Integrase zinc binding domain/Aspartyl protease